jgi:D-alanine--poly(phosphoribitol) ligase subunit 1
VTVPDLLSEIIDHERSGSDLPAVKDPERSLTYGELIDDVSRVGAALKARGVGEGDRVALLLPNSVDFAVAALASLWIGAVFVPLAIDDPPARLTSLVSDCDPALIVTRDDASRDSPPPTIFDSRRIVSTSDLRGEGSERISPIAPGPRGAYIIYTSGTTGTPKGVQIGTVAFGAAVASTARASGLDQNTRALCVSPVHFDGSYANLFATLYAGGSVVLWPRDALLFPRTFFHVVAREGVNYSSFSPSYLRLLLASPQLTELGDSKLEVLAVGGEACLVADVTALWSVLPHVRLFNRYGPTETTITVSHMEVTSDVIDEGVVPIGLPHPEVTFYLFDEDGIVVETPGRVGELYVGGVQNMDGYWGAPELSSDVLRTDLAPGETVYRTGDLVYRDTNGRYVYVDRADRVIKRSGVRVSLVELSETMRRLPHVVGATVTTFDNGGALGIVAFVVSEQPTSSLELRLAAREVIPETMMPNRIDVVEVLPLTNSNKIDERALLSAAVLQPWTPAKPSGSTVHE